MNKAAFSLVALTWFGCQAVSGLNDVSGSFLSNMDEKPKYPPEWIAKCGNSKGEIPLFAEKFDVFTECYSQQLNVFEIPDAFEKARKENQVQTYTKNMCSKMPPVHDCLQNFVQSIQHCFDEAQKQMAWMLVRVVRAATDFICFRDGERILIFLKDEGMECFTEQKAELNQCINSTSLSDLTNDTVAGDVTSLFGINFNEKSCRHIISITNCLFVTLRKCNDRTPSNLLNSLTKKMLKETPCWQYHPDSHAQSITGQKWLVVLSIALTFIYLKTA